VCGRLGRAAEAWSDSDSDSDPDSDDGWGGSPSLRGAEPSSDSFADTDGEGTDGSDGEGAAGGAAGGEPLTAMATGLVAHNVLQVQRAAGPNCEYNL
jgi:hypothetical protein